MVDKLEWISCLSPGKSVCDVGGLWNTVNEIVSVAAFAGAASTTMVDIQPAGNEWWQKFDERCARLGVSGYDSIVADITKYDVAAGLPRFDLVHCSGIIYHVPDPFRLISNLLGMTKEHLILTSMVVVPPLASDDGTVTLPEDVPYLIPTLTEVQRKVFGDYCTRMGLDIAAINAPLPGGSWVDAEGEFPSGPWWWFWTPQVLLRIIQVFPNIELLDAGFSWEQRSYSYLLRKL